MSVAATDAVAAADVLVLLVAAWALGACVLREGGTDERLGAGVVVLGGVCAATMAQRLAGGSVFAHPWILRAVVLGAIGALVAVRRPPLRLAPPPAALAGMVAAGLAMGLTAWVDPTVRPVGDMLLHQGWVRELAGGQTSPGGIYAGVPNAYPWLYHAFAGWILVVLPGGMRVALVVVEAAMVAALALGVWLLARELSFAPSAAAWAAVLALAGGGPGIRDAPAPTPALGNVPPPLPRELGVALVPLVAWLALRAAGRRGAAVAGAAAAMTFLIAPIPGAVAALTGTALVALRRPPRAAIVVATAAAVSLVWLAPLAADYTNLGGFQAVTAEHGAPAWRLAAAVAPLLVLGGWGLVGPARRLDRNRLRALLIIVAVPAASAVLAAVLAGSAPLGAPAVVRDVRYLPLVALACALPAGLAAAEIVSAARSRGALAGMAIVLACAGAPLLASVRTALDPAEAPALTCAPGLTAQAPTTVAVLTSSSKPASGDALALAVFAESGATTLYHSHPRIRFRDAYRTVPTQMRRRSWLRQIAAGRAAPAGVGWVLAPADVDVGPSWGGVAAGCSYLGRRYVLRARDR